MKRILTIAAVLLAIGLMGCLKNSIGPEKEQTSSLAQMQYVGNESASEVTLRLDSLIAQGVLVMTPEERSLALKDLEQIDRHQAQPTAAAAYYTAYTSHYVQNPKDRDLWLEYKWWTGGPRQSYILQTNDYIMYLLVRRCYPQGLTNWSWMEGAYQRVTNVVGTCLYIPYPDWALRGSIRVVVQ